MMRAREYRRHWVHIVLTVVISGVLLLFGLVGVVTFSQRSQAAAHAGQLVLAVLITLVALLLPVEVIGSHRLVVTEDGLRGFRNLHRMVIPWSSVRSFTVGRATYRRHSGWLVSVSLDDARIVPLSGTAGSRNRAERIATELSEALSEYRKLAG